MNTLKNYLKQIDYFRDIKITREDIKWDLKLYEKIFKTSKNFREVFVKFIKSNDEFSENYKTISEKEMLKKLTEKFNKQELANFFDDLSLIGILEKNENLSFSFKEKMRVQEVQKLIFVFWVSFLYYELLEDFDFSNLDFSDLKLDEMIFEFWKTDRETKEKNSKIIANFSRRVFDELEKWDNFRKVFQLNYFYKWFKKYREKEEEKILELKKKWKKEFIEKLQILDEIFYRSYFQSKNLISENRFIGVYSFMISYIKLFENLWFIKREGILFQFTQKITKWFMRRITNFLVEVAYEKFEEILPSPLLYKWIGLVWAFKFWKRKNFVFINNFGIETENLDEFKLQLEEKWFSFLEKESLSTSKDIYLIIKEWKPQNEALVTNQIIKEYEEKLIKNKEIKVKKWRITEEAKTTSLIQKAIEQLQNKQEVVETKKQEESFGNVENIDEKFNGRIFYLIYDEKEFFQIDVNELELVYKNRFFTYIYEKSEHVIDEVNGNIAILSDKKIQKSELIVMFKNFLWASKINRKVLSNKSLFYYSKIIWVNENKQFVWLKWFFKDFDKFMLMKVYDYFNPQTKETERKYVDGFRYQTLKDSFFPNFSIQQFWEFITTEEMQNIWRYNIYQKVSGKWDNISYFLFTRRVLNKEQFNALMTALKKEYKLEII